MENSIVNTMMFNVGELNMTANAISILLPASYIPLAIGATQLTQTPSGVPTNIPIKLLRKRLSEGCLGVYFNKVKKPAAITSPNAMPRQLVWYQFRVVVITRVRKSAFRDAWKWASFVRGSSKASVPERAALVPKAG